MDALAGGVGAIELDDALHEREERLVVSALDAELFAACLVHAPSFSLPPR